MADVSMTTIEICKFTPANGRHIEFIFLDGKQIKDVVIMVAATKPSTPVQGTVDVLTRDADGRPIVEGNEIALTQLSGEVYWIPYARPEQS